MDVTPTKKGVRNDTSFNSKRLLCTMKEIGIIGCGWLGKALAQQLVSEGFQVRATVRQADVASTLRTEGIDARCFSVGDPFPSSFLTGCDFALLSIPVTTRLSADAMQTLVTELYAELPGNCPLVFTSSTGVYRDTDKLIDETSALKPDHPCAQLEAMLQSSFGERCTILRLAGLIGPDRHPVTHLSGKTYENGQHPVNLVHRDDIVRFIRLLMENPSRGETYNLVYPEHPSRKAYYTQEAAERKIPAPIFTIGADSGKTISSEKSVQMGNFSYTHPIQAKIFS